MADFDNRTIRGASATSVESVDAGLRAFMLRVYNYMVTGLALTGVAAWGTYALSVTDNAAQAAATLPNGVMLTQLGVTLFQSSFRWVVVLAPFLLGMFLIVRVSRMKVATAQATFWAYAALLGVSFGVLFIVYTFSSIAQVFFITAATFGAMSLWGYTTKRDLTGMGHFMLMGLIGLMIAMVVNWFLHSSEMQIIVSLIGVIVFTGLTAYDTQKIKEVYYANDNSAVMGQKAIGGALYLYLDFVNLFLFMLRLMGGRR